MKPITRLALVTLALASLPFTVPAVRGGEIQDEIQADIDYYDSVWDQELARCPRRWKPGCATPVSGGGWWPGMHTLPKAHAPWQCTLSDGGVTCFDAKQRFIPFASGNLSPQGCATGREVLASPMFPVPGGNMTGANAASTFCRKALELPLYYQYVLHKMPQKILPYGSAGRPAVNRQ